MYINSMITQMAHFTALRLFIEWGVFDAIPSQDFISLENLAKKVNVDVQLISTFSPSISMSFSSTCFM